MKVTLVAGARPNFMKIAPIIDGIRKAQSGNKKIYFRLVHTGQHYDKNMSGNFFDELGIPEPHVNLESGGGTQAEQTAAIMIAFEKELEAHLADLVMVVGDVTSTLACSIVAKKMCIDVAHVEAGIRSGDVTMPEEINRIVTDAITDLFFTTSVSAGENLRKFGVKESQIHFVGNTMIDTLLKNRSRFFAPPIWEDAALSKKEYFVVTLHRPGNVDEENTLRLLIEEILAHAKGLPVIFPVHPRTAKNLKNIGITAANLYMIEPLGYLSFNYLVENCKAVITDSGGITEETTLMGVPCITLRNSTERPETVTLGTNELIGTSPSAIGPYMQKIFSGEWKKGSIPPLWDGRTADRIIDVIIQYHATKI